MGHYGQLFSGAAYHETVLARHSYLAQASISFADYAGADVEPPRWELEIAATNDSGLFSTATGQSIERRFGSLALRAPYGTFESWNDFVGGTDNGPTYGFQIMFDVRRIYDRLSSIKPSRSGST